MELIMLSSSEHSYSSSSEDVLVLTQFTRVNIPVVDDSSHV